MISKHPSSRAAISIQEIPLHWINSFEGRKRCFTQYGEGQSDSTHFPWPICYFWHSWPPHANQTLVIVVWNFWYNSWLLYIVLERPMSTGKYLGLYFWCGLYFFWCTPGLCTWTYTFHFIYCSPQSGHRSAWCRTSSLCLQHTYLYIYIRFWSFRIPKWFKILCYWFFHLDDKFEAKAKSKQNRVYHHQFKKPREKFKDLFPIILLDYDTLPKAFVKNLGLIFYCDFNFKLQISQTCKICFYHIRDFRHIRKYFSPEAAKSVACALVTSHLDY